MLFPFASSSLLSGRVPVDAPPAFSALSDVRRLAIQESPPLRTPSNPEAKPPIRTRGEGSAPSRGEQPCVLDTDNLRGSVSGG
jgi:hypothetical protein